MKIIQPSVKVNTDLKDPYTILKAIERAGRTCYKSEDLITEDSCMRFVQNIIKRGHESVLEHEKITFTLICDRGVTHEVVRHRLASYSQESTRYVNYNNKEMEFIDPCFWQEEDPQAQYKYVLWTNMMRHCEEAYKKLIEAGARPEEARSVLPNSLKTEIVCTMNIRELRHFLKLRCAKTAHPQMRQVAKMLLEQVAVIPVLFDDLYQEFIVNG